MRLHPPARRRDTRVSRTRCTRAGTVRRPVPRARTLDWTVTRALSRQGLAWSVPVEMLGVFVVTRGARRPCGSHPAGAPRKPAQRPPRAALRVMPATLQHRPAVLRRGGSRHSLANRARGDRELSGHDLSGPPGRGTTHHHLMRSRQVRELTCDFIRAFPGELVASTPTRLRSPG
jgi:hypothetical protein